MTAATHPTRRRAPRGFVILAGALFRAFVRDRAFLFFTVMFPLLFLVVLGGIFGQQTTSKTKVLEIGSVSLLDRAEPRQRSQLEAAFQIVKTGSRDAALAQVREGDAAAAIEQRGGRLVLHISAADQVRSQLVVNVMQGVVTAENLRATGRPPMFSMTARQVEDQALKPIQFLTPGILGWALASACLFGAATTLVNWRTKGILRRLRLAPVSIRSLFAAQVVVTLGITIVQLIVFLSVARLPFFGLRLEQYWWMAIPVVLAGGLAFLSIGMVVGAWAKTQESAQAAAQLLILPMAFLGGSFFPLEFAPGWLRAISYGLPIRYVNEGMLNVLARGQGPLSVLPHIGVLLALAVVGALIAARLFRWDPH
jgi:ABC-type multidrug transport system permease subunit